MTSSQNKVKGENKVKGVYVFASYVRVHAQIIMKINMLVDRYTDSLSFKFDDDPFIGFGEIAKTKSSMHTYHFYMYF